MHQGLEPLGVPLLFLAGVGFVEQRAGGAHLHAFAAVGAGVHIAPGFTQAADDLAVLAAPAHIPHVGSFHLIAHPHPAGAKDAAVVIQAVLGVGEVHAALGEAVGQAAVVHAHLHRQVLQFAVAIGHAHGTHMVAFGEQQLDHGAADFLQPWRVGVHAHPFGGGCDAGGHQPIAPLQLHQAEPAGRHRRDPLQEAEGGDVNARLARRLQQRRAERHGQVVVVDAQGADAHRCTPAAGSSAR